MNNKETLATIQHLFLIDERPYGLSPAAIPALVMDLTEKHSTVEDLSHALPQARLGYLFIYLFIQPPPVTIPYGSGRCFSIELQSFTTIDRYVFKEGKFPPLGNISFLKAQK